MLSLTSQQPENNRKHSQSAESFVLEMLGLKYSSAKSWFIVVVFGYLLCYHEITLLYFVIYQVL